MAGKGGRRRRSAIPPAAVPGKGETPAAPPAGGGAVPPPARLARVLAPAAGVVALRLLAPLAPAEPMFFGVPLGLCLELGVVAAATVSLWFAARITLGETPAATPAARSGPRS